MPSEFGFSLPSDHFYGPWDETTPACTTANYVAIILAMISLFVSCVALCRNDHRRHVVVVSEDGEDKFITV